MSNDQEQDQNEFERLGQQPSITLIGEFWLFIRQNKAWWMIPILLVMGLLAVFMALSSTGAAPFIYTLF